MKPGLGSDSWRALLVLLEGCARHRLLYYLFRYVNGEVELPQVSPPPDLAFI